MKIKLLNSAWLDKMISPFARVEKQGGSLILPKLLQSWGYGLLQPIGFLIAKMGVTANTLTWLSFVLGLCAGLALAVGGFGISAGLLATSSLLDCLDGMVARFTGTASESGEVLDASVDRYTEFFAFSGLAVFYRADVGLMVLTLFALSAAYMVSYSTAKAEALAVTPPKGSMRRPERSLCLILGAGATSMMPLGPTHSWPMVGMLALIAVVGNVSAVLRLAATASVLRERAKPQKAL